MQEAGEKTTDKSDVLKEAVAAMMHFRGTLSSARSRYAELAADLPQTHGPAPDPADYPTKGIGVDGEANTALLKAKRAEHAANEAKIAHAETEAAAHVGYVDDAVREDEPKVRALFDDGTNSQPLPAGTSGSQPGSYSQIQASKARMAKTNSGTLYPDGMGHEILERERENIKEYEAENKPEWNGSQWINADGSAAPATSYAMVETADGLAPLAGGAGGMSALAVAGGGALLGAGVAKAVASKFGGGAARAATAGAASRSAASRSAAAKAVAAGARAGSSGAAGRAAGAGARGAGSRAAGAGARGAGTGAGGRGARGGPAGAGSRAGRAGAAGGRGGRKKDDKQNGQSQDWQADYTDDWTDPNYKATPTVIGDEWKRRAKESDE
ncbi:hypothetical protein FB381_0076 [Nocardioides albertanoniae]|uniref:Uncharacterized protein n=1 Tax=Nocardioides albertanoniae TaxID=1175486 RepID=A0A543A0U9_9ACTN|nr:hypothetical protein [Nocardioides albertanoniae]TQL66227.1 hypothetical protein FB381_0076 [Nocardioides albertanoniae]